ncbi:thiamine phosphate synthase [Prevotella sp. P6B1]|uniref:thiamine phosphate synthase n=1 Tax=Prevotella sp. P6B1 TaxID=1410613 RepID=UPI00051B9733|nr:thiamine phosphate synthase [Prevotella sp. P6B1]
MKLIVMTKPTFFVEEDKILADLFEEGLENLHLYKPGASPMYSERLLTLLGEDYHNKITVHGHFYLKEEYHLRGIHIDDAHTEPPIGYKGNISRTCHAIDELKDTKKKSNYVFLHSIFDSQTNANEKQSFTMDELREASKQGLIDKKVYALGGMNLDRVKEIKDLGFGGLVICGDLWNRFNIHNEIDYKALLTHFEKLRKTIK